MLAGSVMAEAKEDKGDFPLRYYLSLICVGVLVSFGGATILLHWHSTYLVANPDPLAVHCAFNALALAWVVRPGWIGFADLERKPITSVRLVIALIVLALACINIYVALSGPRIESNVWLRVLWLAAAALDLWALGVGTRQERRESKARAKDDDVTTDMVIIAEKATRIQPLWTLVLGLLYPLLFTLYWAAALTILMSGVVYAIAMSEALNNFRFAGWQLALDTFTQAAQTLPRALAPVAIALFVLFGGLLFGRAFWQTLLSIRYSDYNRELTDSDRAKILAASNDVVHYVRQLKIDRSLRLGFIVWLLIIIATIAACVGVILLANLFFGESFYGAARVAGYSWYFYRDYISVAGLCAIFTTVAIMFAASMADAYARRRYGHASFIRTIDPLISVTSDLRKHLLPDQERFLPDEFFDRHLRGYGKTAFALAALLIAFNLVLLYLGRKNYELVTENFIEYTDFWTTEIHRIGYGDLSAAEITCEARDREHFNLDYDLVVRAGARKLGLDTRKLIAHPDIWEHIDASLRAAKVPIRYAIDHPLFEQPHVAFNTAECTAEIISRAGPSGAARILKLLRATTDSGPNPDHSVH